jgi:Skp family chaperone for outer membrane proteins
LAKEIEHLEQEAKKIHGERQVYEPDAVTYAEMTGSLQRLLGEKQLVQDEYQHRSKAYRDFMDLQAAKLTLKIYDDVVKQIYQVAAARGFDLVLKVDADNAAAGVLERMVRLRNKTVIYHRPQIDITEDVIRVLNQ